MLLEVLAPLETNQVVRLKRALAGFSQRMCCFRCDEPLSLWAWT